MPEATRPLLVRTSRVGNGRVIGMVEYDKLGMIPGDTLNAQKARVLLMLALTKTLAVEYAQQGLRANSVSPGSIDTPITGAFALPEGADGRLLRRIMSPTGMAGPEVVAAAIAYLGSDDATHVNGEDLRIDGATHA